MLTKGLDNVPGTAGNDTIIGSITGGAVGDDLNTLSALDVVNGGAGTDTLKIASSVAAIVLPNMSNVEVVEIEGTAGVTVNTSAVAGVTNLNVLKHGTVKVDATAAATTDIAVTVKEDNAAGSTLANVIKGGKNVTVTGTDLGTAAGTNADTITVGGAGALAAAGTVTVNSTGAASVAATDKTLSAITVTGGTTVTVTQKASSDATAAAADTVGATITQGKVSVNGNTSTTTVTVNQDKAVAEVLSAAAVTGKAATQDVTFTEAKKGDTVKLDFGTGELTFTAKKDLTAAEVASAFANLATDAVQGNASATLGLYTDATGGVTNKWTSGAVQTVSATQSKVTFSTTDLAAGAGTQAASQAITTAVTGTVTATAAAGVGGINAVTGTNVKTGVLGVATGEVDIADSGAGFIKTITVDGYNASSSITGSAVLETLTLKNAENTADMTVADTAATLGLTVEKLGYTNTGATATAVLTLTAAPTTLNVASVGANTINLTAAATETLNVSGTGLLNISATDLAGLKTVKVTETAGLTLKGTENDTLTSVDTTGTTGTVTLSINGDKATYTGGAGVDNVTVSNPATAIAKAINLGAGNDRLDLSAATPAIPTVTLAGGTGDDTLVLTAADAASLAAGTAFEAKIDSFEKLEVKAALGNSANSINLTNLNDINYVITNGMAAGDGNVQEIQTFTVTSGVTAKKVNATQTIDFAAIDATADGNFTVGGVTVGVLAADTDAQIAGKVAAALNGVKVTPAGGVITTQNVKAAAVGTVVTITYDTRDGAPSAQLAVANGTATLAAGFVATTTAGTAYSANAKTITIGGVTVNTLVSLDVDATGATVAGSGDDTADEVAGKMVTALDAATATYNAAGTGNVAAAMTVKFAEAGDKSDITLVAGTSGVTIGAITEATAGKMATELTFTNLTSGGTVEMKAAGVSTVATVKDATTNLTDVLNVKTNAANNADLGVLTADKVETINVAVVDTDTSTAVSLNTLKIDGDKAKTINITGDGNLTLTLSTDTTALTLIDASSNFSGILTATTGTTGLVTVKGGSGKDVLTAAGANDVLQGGAGNDTLKVTTGTAVTLTGGDGTDAFDVSGYKGTVGGAATVTDLAKGETLKFVSDAAADFNSAKVTLISEATFTEYVAEAMKVASVNSTVTHGVAWFQFTQGGTTNTFVVQNMAADNSFNDGTDIIVKLTGAVDLSASSFNEVGQGTLLFI